MCRKMKMSPKKKMSPILVSSRSRDWEGRESWSCFSLIKNVIVLSFLKINVSFWSRSCLRKKMLVLPFNWILTMASVKCADHFIFWQNCYMVPDYVSLGLIISSEIWQPYKSYEYRANLLCYQGPRHFEKENWLSMISSKLHWFELLYISHPTSPGVWDPGNNLSVWLYFGFSRLFVWPKVSMLANKTMRLEDSARES